MKKTAAILLCFILLFDSFGYILVYISLNSRYKEEIEEILNGELTQQELELIVIPRNTSNLSENGTLNLSSLKEIQYEGMMFDVYSGEIIGDSIYLYCYHDFKEESLLKKLNTYVESKSNEKHSAINTLYELSKLRLICLTFDEFDIHCYPCFKNELRLKDKEALITPALDIPSPPPKAFSYSLS